MPIEYYPKIAEKKDAEFLPYRIAIDRFHYESGLGTHYTTPIAINVEGLNRIGYKEMSRYPEGSPADADTIQRIIDMVPLVGQFIARETFENTISCGWCETEAYYGFDAGRDALVFRVRETEDGFELIGQPSDDEILRFRRRYGIHYD